MAGPIPTLVTAAELRTLATQAVALLEALSEQEPAFTGKRALAEAQQRRAAIEALRFVAAAAPIVRDGSLVAILGEALELCAPFDDRPTDDVDTIALGVTELLRGGAPVGDGVRALASNENARVREAIASGLRPTSAPSLMLLEKLATDPVPEVRKAARTSMAPVREVPWWSGKFASDPMTRLPPEAAAKLRPTLERISALLDEPAHRWDSRQQELADLAATLPDPLVVELGTSVLAAHPPWGRDTAVGMLMLGREGGTEALIQLIGRWAGQTESFYRMELAKRVVAALEPEERFRVCRTLLDHALKAPASQRAEFWGAPSLLAQLAAQGWPEEHLDDLLDAVARDRTPEDDRVMTELYARLAGAEHPPPALLGRAVEARRSGYARMDRGLARALDKVLEHAPREVLRELAEQAIRRDDDEEVEWGLMHLLGRFYDPERDLPGTELAARLFAEPRYRRVFVRSDELAPFVLPLLRQTLRTRQATFPEAYQAMRTIGELYGGVASQRGWISYGNEEDDDDSKGRRKRRNLLRNFLGPKKLQGPPTAREWDCFRAARGKYLASASAGTTIDWRAALEVLPPGPWDPLDRQAFDAARAAFRAGDDDAGVGIAYALIAKPDLADLPIFDELRERVCPASGLFQIARRRVRELLGLPEEDDEESAPAVTIAREWMDEPEED